MGFEKNNHRIRIPKIGENDVTAQKTASNVRYQVITMNHSE
jgi:hypothetical protein